MYHPESPRLTAFTVKVVPDISYLGPGARRLPEKCQVTAGTGSPVAVYRKVTCEETIVVMLLGGATKDGGTMVKRRGMITLEEMSSLEH